jgi:hypothetical protein
MNESSEDVILYLHQCLALIRSFTAQAAQDAAPARLLDHWLTIANELGGCIVRTISFCMHLEAI